MPRRHEHDRATGPAAASQRQLRVGEELRHALAQLLRPGELRDPALREANITVSEVRVSPDLRNATAFVMPLAGANAEQLAVGSVQSEGRDTGTVSLRAGPALRATRGGCILPKSRSASMHNRGSRRRQNDDPGKRGRAY